MHFRFAFMLYAAALLPAAAIAQSMAPGNPAAPGAAVPALKYESAFADYRTFRDEKPAPWRELNDEVARIGGHIGIVRGSGHAGHGAAGAKPAAPGAGGK